MKFTTHSWRLNVEGIDPTFKPPLFCSITWHNINIYYSWIIIAGLLRQIYARRSAHSLIRFWTFSHLQCVLGGLPETSWMRSRKSWKKFPKRRSPWTYRKVAKYSLAETQLVLNNKSSSWTAWTWRWRRHYAAWERRELFTDRKFVTSLKIWMFNSTAVLAVPEVSFLCLDQFHSWTLC